MVKRSSDLERQSGRISRRRVAHNMVDAALGALRQVGGRAVVAAAPIAPAVLAQAVRTRAKRTAGKSVKEISRNSGGVTGGYAKVMSKKRKSKRGKTRRVSKKVRKSIKRIAKAADWDLLYTTHLELCGQLLSANNKVDWVILEEDTSTNLKALVNVQYEAANAVSGTTAPENIDFSELSQTGQINKAYRKKLLSQYVLKNNTNTGAELVFYECICIDKGAVDPLADIDALMLASTTSASGTDPIAKEDVFGQYWSVKGENKASRHWKISKKSVIHMNPGDEIKYIYDPITRFKYTDDLSTYMKGYRTLICRTVGKVTHDASTATNVGISFARVDFLNMSDIEVRAKDDRTTIRLFRGEATKSATFAAATAVVGGDATVASAASA